MSLDQRFSKRSEIEPGLSRNRAKPRPHRFLTGRLIAALVGLPAFAAGLAIPQSSAQDGSQLSRDTVPAQPLVELASPGGGIETGAPVTITLEDALDRARKNSAQYLSAVIDARNAHEGRIQARAALLPSAGATTQELLTKGDGALPTGRFVTNDGVHVYRAWGIVHQEFSPNLFTLNGYHRATVEEALAQAREEIAGRGLAVAVTGSYYDLLIAQRRYATSEKSLDQARRFTGTARERERGGEVAHSDVIKAELRFEQQEQGFEEARLNMENARLNLAVLLFPALNENFTVVDDLDQSPPLPPFEDVRAMAVRADPDLRVAMDAVTEANLEVAAARHSFLPTLTVDADYGIEANAFALRSTAAGETSLPPRVGNNLGEFVTANLQVPVWDWGALRSKLHQAEWRRQQARVELTSTQRRVVADLYSFYNEAAVAQASVDLLRHSAELASESLRLTNLRYQAGEATALEVVDAQSTLTQARNAYDDGQARYRVTLANLQTLTGSF